MTTAPKSANAGLFDMLGSTVPAASAAAPRQAATIPGNGSFGFASSGAAPNYISPISAQTQTATPAQPAMTSRPSYTSSASGMASPASATSKPAASASAFDDLFSASLSGISTGEASGASNARSAAGGKTIKEMEQEKAMNSLWGNGASAQATRPGAGQSAAAKQAQQAGNFDDLLM